MRPELEVQFWKDGQRVVRGVHLTEAQLSALMWALYDYRHEPKRREPPVTWVIPKCH